MSLDIKLIPTCNVYSAIVYRLIHEVKPGFKLSEFSREITIELSTAYQCGDPNVKELLSIASSTIDDVFDNASRLFNVVLLLDMEAISRIVIHTRSPFMPLEIGIAWHPYLNLPYIPSTSLKGVLRAYIEGFGVEACGIPLRSLLGSTDEMSGIMVSDALPVACTSTIIQPDVLTPHYSEAKGDISEVQAKPVPLVFPTIAPGTRLKFVVAINIPRNLIEKLGLRGNTFMQTLLCLAKELPKVIEAAFQFGVGAKTSVGYGAIRISPLNYATRGEDI